MKMLVFCVVPAQAGIHQDGATLAIARWLPDRGEDMKRSILKKLGYSTKKIWASQLNAYNQDRITQRAGGMTESKQDQSRNNTIGNFWLNNLQFD